MTCGLNLLKLKMTRFRQYKYFLISNGEVVSQNEVDLWTFSRAVHRLALIPIGVVLTILALLFIALNTAILTL